MTNPQCPHGHMYGTCLMCYHGLVAEQQSEIERLRTALKKFGQHPAGDMEGIGRCAGSRRAEPFRDELCDCGLNAALEPYDDNGQYLKEMPAAEQEGVLTIVRDVTTVSPNFTMTVRVSEPGEPRKPMLTDRADELIRELHQQGLVTMRSVFDGAILTILPDRPAMEDASRDAARGPCSLCGRTDNHTHTAGPFGMS